MPKKNQNTSEHQKDSPSCSLSATDKSSGHGGFGRQQESNKPSFGGGFGARQQPNKPSYGGGGGFGKPQESQSHKPSYGGGSRFGKPQESESHKPSYGGGGRFGKPQESESHKPSYGGDGRFGKPQEFESHKSSYGGGGRFGKPQESESHKQSYDGGGGFGKPQESESHKPSYGGGGRFGKPQESESHKPNYGGGGGFGKSQMSHKQNYGGGGGGFSPPQQSYKSSYRRGGDEFGGRQQYNKPNHGRGFDAPQHKANYGRGSGRFSGGGFGAPQQSRPAPAWGASPAWEGDSAGTNTTSEQPSYNYNSSTEGVEDWDEPTGFVADPSPVLKDAPAPTVNVWQQRIEFYQAAVPSSVDEEEQMLQAALEISRMEDEKEKLRLKHEEEQQQLQLAAIEKASIAAVSRAQPETAPHGHDSLYAYNGAVPPPRPVVPQKDITSPEDTWPATSPTSSDAPPSSVWKSNTRAEPDRIRVPGFQRGVGRGSHWGRQGSRTVSVSSDANSEPIVGHTEPRSPCRSESELLSCQLQPQNQQTSQHKTPARTVEQPDVWDSGSDCEEDLGKIKDSACKDPARIPFKMPGDTAWMSDKDQRKNVHGNSSTAMGDNDQTVPVNRINENNALKLGEGDMSQDESNSSAPTSSSTKRIDPVLNDASHEAAQSGSRVVRRQYGPRARGRKIAAAAGVPKIPAIPVTTSDSACPTVPKTPIPDKCFFTEEDTSAKLLDLCNVTQKTKTEHNPDLPKKNIFGDHNVAGRLNSAPHTTTACEKNQLLVPDPVMSTEFSESMLPNTAIPLDLSKPTTPATSDFNSIAPGNGGAGSVPIDDLRSQLGGLGLGGTTWPQQFMNVANPWAASSIMGEAMASNHQQISASSSESSDFTPNRSPGLPDAQGEKRDKPYNPIGNVEIGSYMGYCTPYMSMYMPQMYGMGFPGMPITPGVGLGLPVSGVGLPASGVGLPASGVADGAANTPQSNTNFQVPGMPFGMLPSMIPQVVMPVQGMPGVTGQGMPGMTGQGVTGVSGQGIPRMPDRSGQAMPGMSAPVLQGMSGQAMFGMSDQVMQGMSCPVMPGVPGQAMPGIAGQLLPGVSGQVLPGVSGQVVPGVSDQSISALPSQEIPGLSGHGMPVMSGQAMSSASGEVTSGQAVPGVAGQEMPGVSGQVRPGLSGQAMPSVSGQVMPSVSGQVMPGMYGQVMPVMPGQAIPVMSGQAMPGVPGQAMPGLSHQVIPGMSGQAMPSMSGQVMPGASLPAMPLSSHAMPGLHSQGMTAPSMPPGLNPDNVPSNRADEHSADANRADSHRADSQSPVLPAPQPTNNSTQSTSTPWEGNRMMNGLMNGGMPQCGLAFSNFRGEASLPASGEHGQGLPVQPSVSPPLLPPAMSMLPGMIPFLPTLPLIPQHYNSAGFGAQDMMNKYYNSQYNVKNVD